MENVLSSRCHTGIGAAFFEGERGKDTLWPFTQLMGGVNTDRRAGRVAEGGKGGGGPVRYYD